MKETECNEQPVNLSSTVIANVVVRLMGTPCTMTDIPSVMSVKHTNPVMAQLQKEIELRRFFNEHNIA